jgi:hypothetical protein
LIGGSDPTSRRAAARRSRSSSCWSTRAAELQATFRPDHSRVSHPVPAGEAVSERLRVGRRRCPNSAPLAGGA